jgi:hypothetical protein
MALIGTIWALVLLVLCAFIIVSMAADLSI